MDHIRHLAKEIRAALNLRGWVDVEYVARELGLHVDDVPFTGPNVTEITIGNSIGIRAGLPSIHRRWAIAHGLGHAMLHSGDGNQVWLYASDQPTVKEEMEAEAFAMFLLVDSGRIQRTGMGETWEIAAFYGVPLTKLGRFYGGFA